MKRFTCFDETSKLIFDSDEPSSLLFEQSRHSLEMDNKLLESVEIDSESLQNQNLHDSRKLSSDDFGWLLNNSNAILNSIEIWGRFTPDLWENLQELWGSSQLFLNKLQEPIDSESLLLSVNNNPQLGYFIESDDKIEPVSVLNKSGSIRK